MNSRDSEDPLRVGDRVRIVRMPTDFSKPGYYVHADTRCAYKRLIARGRSLRVFNVDEFGLPWVRFRFKRKNGTWEHHELAINDDSWVRVRRR